MADAVRTHSGELARYIRRFGLDPSATEQAGGKGMPRNSTAALAAVALVWTRRALSALDDAATRGVDVTVTGPGILADLERIRDALRNQSPSEFARSENTAVIWLATSRLAIAIGALGVGVTRAEEIEAFLEGAAEGVEDVVGVARSALAAALDAVVTAIAEIVSGVVGAVVRALGTDPVLVAIAVGGAAITAKRAGLF